MLPPLNAILSIVYKFRVSVAVARHGHATLDRCTTVTDPTFWPSPLPHPVSRSRLEAEPGMVVECADSGFCGAVVDWRRPPKAERFFWRTVMVCAAGSRWGRAFLVEGRPATLVRQRRPGMRVPSDRPSGSVYVDGLRAQVARASRIWVEGIHDAELIEHVWGHDLRVEAVVVEPLHGAR